MKKTTTLVWAASISMALAGCGRSDKKAPPADPPPKPTPAPVRDQMKPVERPSRVPAFFALDELGKRHPTVPNARLVAPLALDASGKQATATWCVVAADARPAMHAVADQYDLITWRILTRQTSPDNAKGQIAADFDVADATLHMQGQLRRTAACNADEIAVELSYTKMVPLDAAAPTPPGGDRAPVPPAPTP